MRRILFLLLISCAHYAQSQSYCIPTYTGNGCSLGVGIKSVTINGTALSTNTPCATNYYTDYTTSVAPIILSKTAPNPFTVEYHSNANGQGLKIWIDFDMNGIFELTDRVFDISNITSTVNGTFNLPNGLISKIKGSDVRRMRIRNKLNDSPYESCTTYDYGETEDYLVRIADIDPSITASSITNGCAVQLSAQPIPANLPIKWQKNGADIPGATNTTYNPASNGTYRAVSQQKDFSWTFQNNKPQGNTVNKTFFVNANTGWCVGGAILKTTDGGQTWAQQKSGMDRTALTNVFFLNVNVGFATSDGAILKTTDGGTNWTVVYYEYNPINSAPFRSLFFINSTTGWAGEDDKILKTTDGGTTWVQCSVNLSFYDFSFINPTTGWAVRSTYPNNVYKTIDGGFTWTPQTTPSGTTFMYGIQFVDANNGWACGGTTVGHMMRTTDGGTTWTNKNIGGFLETINDLHFINGTTGWAVGGKGVIFRTTDGGDTWVPQTSGTNHYLTTVFFTDANNGFVAGLDGLMLRTTNGGDTWSPVGTMVTFNGLSQIKMLNTTTGWVAGEQGTILKTTNGGNTWNAQNSGTIKDINGLSFIDANNGWATFSDSGLLRTTDGGSSWNPQSVSSGPHYFGEIAFTDANIGYAIDNRYNPGPKVIKTTNGGASWTVSSMTANYGLERIKVLGSSVWAFSEYRQTLFRTPDGGTNWYAVNIDASQSFLSIKDISFIDVNNGWAFCEGGSSNFFLYKTNNGGANWTLIYSNPRGGSYPSHGFFVNANQGWMFGYHRSYTNDGGLTWIPDGKDPNFNASQLQFVDANNGWVIGAGGTIMKYNTNTNQTAYQSNAINVTLGTAPTPSIAISSGSNAICAGQSVTLNASNCTGMVTWSTGATGTSLTVTPQTTTNYTATCSQAGCTTSPNSNTITISVNGIPATLNLSGTAANGTQQATQEITSTQTIAATTNVGYRAGKSVTLNPGYNTQNGAVFKAEIGGVIELTRSESKND